MHRLGYSNSVGTKHDGVETVLPDPSGGSPVPALPFFSYDLFSYPKYTRNKLIRPLVQNKRRGTYKYSSYHTETHTSPTSHQPRLGWSAGGVAVEMDVNTKVHFHFFPSHLTTSISITVLQVIVVRCWQPQRRSFPFCVYINEMNVDPN